MSSSVVNFSMKNVPKPHLPYFCCKLHSCVKYLTKASLGCNENTTQTCLELHSVVWFPAFPRRRSFAIYKLLYSARSRMQRYQTMIPHEVIRMSEIFLLTQWKPYFFPWRNFTVLSFADFWGTPGQQKKGSFNISHTHTHTVTRPNCVHFYNKCQNCVTKFKNHTNYLFGAMHCVFFLYAARSKHEGPK